MATRFTRGLAAVAGLLLACPPAAAQGPSLSREQRTLLQALVRAVDSASAQPATPGAALTTDVLRASDGSHYVAFGVTPPAAMPLPAGPVMLYVRLAAAASTAGAAERSAVREWLAGTTAAPVPWFSRSGIAIGDMPAFGASANLSLRPYAVQGSTDLQTLSLERDRQRRDQDQHERQRRAELEGTAPPRSDVLPFEDFDLAASAVAVAGSRRIERALTTGPGDYTLTVAWADAAATDAPAIQVVRTSLRLAATPPDTLAISSVILADRVEVRAAAYPPAQQAAHPYAIGLTEITPAPDHVLTGSERLSVAFQIIGARPSERGKPDVEAALRIVRVVSGREEAVASLTPQSYTPETVPANFDLRVGHPLLVALSAPVDSLRRGDYRLKIDITDRHAGRTAAAEADFTIGATLTALLKEAPPPAARFPADAAVSGEVLAYVTRALRPSSPSPALRAALDAVAAGRFVDVTDAPVAESEEGVRAAVRGLGLLAVSDASAAAHFQRAVLLGVPAGPARLLSGAARALQGRDADAIAAWQEALKAGAPLPLVAPFLLDAYVRRADYTRATALVTTTSPPTTPMWQRGMAALAIGTGRERDALPLLDALRQARPDDADVRWLRLYALYALIVSGDGARRDGFMAEARAYVEAKGPHEALVREWLALVDPPR